MNHDSRIDPYAQCIRAGTRPRVARDRRCWAATFLLIPLALCIASIAAPILPSKSGVGDDFQSIQGLMKVCVGIEPLPNAMIEAGLDAQQLREIVTGALTAAGMQVLDEPEAEDRRLPLLMFKSRMIGPRPDQDPAAFVLLVEVKQPVHVHRLGRDLFVPTYTLGVHDLTTHEELAATASEQARILALEFAHNVGWFDR